MILWETNNPRIDQVLYYFYKTDDHMEEHSPKLNSTGVFLPEFHHVPELTKDDKVDHDLLASGE